MRTAIFGKLIGQFAAACESGDSYQTVIVIGCASGEKLEALNVDLQLPVVIVV